MIDRAELPKIYQRLLYFAVRLSHNHDRAQDLVQTAILKALEHEHQFQSGTNLFSWVSKILFNEFCAQRRRDTMKSSHAWRIGVDDMTPPNQVAEGLDLLDAVGSLRNPEYRDLIQLAATGMTYEEMAEKVGIPVETVRSRLCRARALVASAC